MNTTNVPVIVKFFNDSKGFGFLKQQSGPDIFVHVDVLTAFGFKKADVVMDLPAVVDFQSTRKGLVATKIHSIGAKKTPPTELSSVVDRHNGLLIVKVTEVKTGRYVFEIRKDSIEGDKVGNDFFVLAEARQAIGKSMPVIETVPVKTNVPGRGPVKGPSPAVPSSGSGQPKKKEKKKAA